MYENGIIKPITLHSNVDNKINRARATARRIRCSPSNHDLSLKVSTHIVGEN